MTAEVGGSSALESFERFFLKKELTFLLGLLSDFDSFSLTDTLFFSRVDSLSTSKSLLNISSASGSDEARVLEAGEPLLTSDTIRLGGVETAQVLGGETSVWALSFSCVLNSLLPRREAVRDSSFSDTVILRDGDIVLSAAACELVGSQAVAAAAGKLTVLLLFVGALTGAVSFFLVALDALGQDLFELVAHLSDLVGS
jgi:hypothetical protein